MDLTAIPIAAADGSETDLRSFAGNVLLIVNTASRCGFTPQYEGLGAVYSGYRHRGFKMLAFPCNQFAAHEPGDAQESVSFCKLTYDVTFPIFGKVDVNGEETAPLYRELKQEAKGVLGSEAIKWNFTKFLVNREGQVVERYAPTTRPEAIAQDIERLL